MYYVRPLLYDIVHVPLRLCQGFCLRITVMILRFRTDRSEQTEQQSDQGLHCLPFRLHRLGSLLYGRATQFKF